MACALAPVANITMAAAATSASFFIIILPDMTPKWGALFPPAWQVLRSTLAVFTGWSIFVQGGNPVH
jgi:hypothetical protein